MTSLHQTISVTLLVVLLPFGEMLNVKKGSKMPWNQQKCTALENHEVYTSVKVAIGNPPQNFDLVADTGSDNCIVQGMPRCLGILLHRPSSLKAERVRKGQRGFGTAYIFINNHTYIYKYHICRSTSFHV